jgi:hypothetical protein
MTDPALDRLVAIHKTLMVAPYGHALMRSTTPLVDSQAYTGSASVKLVPEKDPVKANLVSSRIGESKYHSPVLDIDMPCQVLPSSSPGHHHLYIDHPMEWDTYRLLLQSMAQAGILEWGFVSSSVERGYSAVRTPWVKK